MTTALIHLADFSEQHPVTSVTQVQRATAFLLRIHSATACGSNRTHVPILNEGILPLAACLKIVIRETDSSEAS